MPRGALASSPLFTLLRRATLGAASLLLGISTQGCGETQIKISILDPEGLRTNEDLKTTWVEFDIFKGKCPSKFDLADGNYEPYRKQIVNDLADPPEAFQTGKLATDIYGFAVVLRSDNCAIVGYGCAKADLSTVREINIKLNPTYVNDSGEPAPKGACEAPQICDLGVCIDSEEEPPPDET